MCLLMSRPRDNLIGRKLGDWRITVKVIKAPDQSGGNFSSGYEAVNEVSGQIGFVKAMDLHDAAPRAKKKKTSVLDEAYHLLSDYRFERDLLIDCRNKKLSRIVVALEHDEIQLDANDPLMSTVGYLLFDKADGDVRKQVSQMGFSATWNLFALKEVAIGLLQLHNTGVVHQDLKPSNVLIFGGSNTKIADLGCAHIEAFDKSPRGKFAVPGDRTYAPIELLYEHVGATWKRHLQTDLYLLGNFATFLFSGASITALIEDYLEDEYHWDGFEGDYRDILPEVSMAFASAIELIKSDVPEELKEEVCSLITQLCHPDPEARGYIRGRYRTRTSQYALQPFVTKFSELAFRAGRGLLSTSIEQ